MGTGLLSGLVFIGVFIFFTLLFEILRLRSKLFSIQNSYNELDKNADEIISQYCRNNILHKFGLEYHTQQMIDFANLLYYTEDNVPKYGKKLADLVLESKENGTLYRYFLSLVNQYDITEGNVYSKLQKEYSLVEKDILICALLNHGFTSQQIWTICNSNESAYYTRCSRLRTKLKLVGDRSIPEFVKGYVKANLSEPKLLHK